MDEDRYTSTSYRQQKKHGGAVAAGLDGVAGGWSTVFVSLSQSRTLVQEAGTMAKSARWSC